MKIVEKPWGHEEIWAHTDKYVGKLLHIRDGCRLSLQFHQEKMETVRVMQGKLKLTLGNKILFLEEGECRHIAAGVIHRMEAYDGDVIVIEVSTPELEDVVRLADDFQRVQCLLQLMDG